MRLFGGKKCTNCGYDLPDTARFCPVCGQPAPDTQIRCGRCGSLVPAGANFCASCGQPLPGTAAPPIRENRWAKGVDDFAIKVEEHDLQGILNKDLTVEPGTQAILLADGQTVGVVGPGFYPMASLLEKFVTLGQAKQRAAILIDSGDVELAFTVPDLFTSDPLRVTLECRVVVELANPIQFLTHMMHGRRNYTLTMLRDYLFDEVQMAAQDAVSRHAVADLATNLNLQREFDQAIEMQLNTSLGRSGLRFVRVRTLNYRHPRYDEVTKVQEEYFLQISKEEADLQGRKRLFDVLDQKQIQAIAEETRQVEHHERRVQVWERMRRAVLSDRMNEVRSEDDLQAFLTDMDRQKLIRREEMDRLVRDFAEQKEDRELARRYVVQRLEMERKIELDKMELRGQTELLELRLKRREMELQAQLNEERMQALERKKTEIEARQQDLAIALQTAKAAAEIMTIEREQDKLDGELGMYMLELMDARKIKKQRDEMLLEAEREEKALERRLREERARHEAEMERLQLLSQASVELLITVSGPDQARLLADLKQTQTLAGMTEEQILARAAEHSPEVARAFQEKFRGLPAEQQAAMYERMLKDRDTAAAQLAEALREAARMQQEATFKALETQKDVSVAYARGGTPPVVVTPGVGPAIVSAGRVGDLSTGEVQVCPRCKAKSPVGTKFCANCGERFYE